MILLDTNVLVYALNADAPQHADSRAIVEAGFARKLPVALLPQVLVEAYAVLTDARRVERPLAPREAWSEIQALQAGLPVFDLPVKVLDSLSELISEGEPIGQEIFDVLLVAQMRAHGIATICTYNTEDFERFAGIRAETPEEILAHFGISRRSP